MLDEISANVDREAREIITSDGYGVGVLRGCPIEEEGLEGIVSDGAGHWQTTGQDNGGQG